MVVSASDYPTNQPTNEPGHPEPTKLVFRGRFWCLEYNLIDFCFIPICETHPRGDQCIECITQCSQDQHTCNLFSIIPYSICAPQFANAHRSVVYILTDDLTMVMRGKNLLKSMKYLRLKRYTSHWIPISGSMRSREYWDLRKCTIVRRPTLASTGGRLLEARIESSGDDRYRETLCAYPRLPQRLSTLLYSVSKIYYYTLTYDTNKPSLSFTFHSLNPKKKKILNQSKQK